MGLLVESDYNVGCVVHAHLECYHSNRAVAYKIQVNQTGAEGPRMKRRAFLRGVSGATMALPTLEAIASSRK